MKACAERPPADPACRLRQSTNETSQRAGELILEGIKLHKHSPCLCKDGNVFQITDGCMEILVARLDFSLLEGSAPARLFSSRLQ